LPGHPGKGKLGPDTIIGTYVSLSVRPEQIALTRIPAAFEVRVKNRIFLGEHTEYLVNSATLGDFLVLVSRQAEAVERGFAPDDTAYASWNPETALILTND
jgi:spermidine/putrescine transport system ATP-binding protein